MADNEDYFPRGGKKPTTTRFRQNENFLGVTGKAEKKKKRIKKKSEDDDGYLSDEVHAEDDQSYKTCSIWLHYKVVKEGLLLLGRVYQVLETKVHISLPCRMNGIAMACHISEAYNKLLEAYVNDQTDKVMDLAEMFRPGQYVAVKVLEGGDSRLMVSLMPQHIYSNRTLTDLHKGALLQAAVSSVEDHGYVVDIGIPNTRAFLPKDSANTDIRLDVGMLTWVCVTSNPSMDTSVIKLSNQLTDLQKAFQRNTSNVLYPGTSFEFTVDKPLDNGIEGHIVAGTMAYIQRHQAGTLKGKKPKLGQKIRARLLYAVPPNNIPFLTMKDIFNSSFTDLAEEQKFKEGDIIEEAKVIKITGRSVHLKLDEGSVGILSLRRVAIHEDLTDEQVLLKSYPIGSHHKVRVLCYNLSDYVYSVSDDASLLNEKYFSLSQLNVGDLVKGTISVVADKYLRVNIGRVNGYVPQSHMTEAGIFIDPKKATNSMLSKKKFKVGQEVLTRVLLIDKTKQQLTLSLKPSFLEEDLVVLKSYHEAEVGKMYTGVVAQIKNYILASFFNNVMAYIPRNLVSTEPVDNLADAFHQGQIIKCTIISVNPELKKLTASLTNAPFTPGKSKQASKRKAKDKGNDGTAKKQKIEKSIERNSDEDEPEIENGKKKRKKVQKETNDTEIGNISDANQNKKPKKKKKDKITDEEPSDQKKKTKESKTKKEEVHDSDSDAIETDIHEDSDQVLTSEDRDLIDLSSCVSQKNYKKRVADLHKSIETITNRLNSLDKKIEDLEEKGLSAKNKKFHTAMHSEKLIIEERLKNIVETLTIAQEKLNQFDVKDKKKKKLKKGEIKDEKEEVKDDKVGVKVVEILKPAIEIPSAKDFWSTKAEVVDAKKEDSSSSEEEEEEKPKKKRKKLTVAEKAAKAREEEERIRELEKRAIESENAPRSSDQFERALLAEPNCSQLWIAYMAFHLQATEIDKARAVGKKALNTINFREEAEKLNVWLALLNLEHRFGTKESQQKTLEDALQMNDTYQVHSKLLDILVDTSKHQELVSLVELVMRKYRRESRVYIKCGEACFAANLVDKARYVMQKGIAALEKKEHVSLLVRFAQLERSQGDRERAEALFEQVLAVYPQRVDVCCAYVDMLLAAKDLERIRQVLERMTSQKLPARKMKVLFKKWIEVEEKIGDQNQVESIRQRALEFIDKAKF